MFPCIHTLGCSALSFVLLLDSRLVAHQVLRDQPLPSLQAPVPALGEPQPHSTPQRVPEHTCSLCLRGLCTYFSFGLECRLPRPPPLSITPPQNNLTNSRLADIPFNIAFSRKIGFFFSISKTFTYSSHFVSEGRYNLGFPGGSTVKNPPANTGDLRDASSISGSGRFPLEEGTATHSSILAWEIPWRGAWQAV